MDIEEIQKWVARNYNYIDLSMEKTGCYTQGKTQVLFNCYKARDAEIKELRKYINELKIECNSRGKRLVLLGEDNITFYATEF